MIDEYKIYLEHQLETLSRVPDSFVDLTMTSPPYDDMNENFEVIQRNGMRTYTGYSWDFKKLAEELYRVTKMGGVVVWVVNDPVVDGSKSLASAYQKIYFRKCGFDILDTMIYEKNGCSMPDKYRYLQSFEYMIVLTKGRPKTVNFIKDRKNRFPNRWGEGRTVREKDGRQTARKKIKSEAFGRRFNIWRYNTGAGYSTKDKVAFEHPAIFPEKLVADHVNSWTNEGDVVYDPFAGSGTTQKVCEVLNRKCFGSEISKEYFSVSDKRKKANDKKLKLF